VTFLEFPGKIPFPLMHIDTTYAAIDRVSRLVCRDWSAVDRSGAVTFLSAWIILRRQTRQRSKWAFSFSVKLMTPLAKAKMRTK
jgi:hypothetical protein